jgi:hypothetical protein
MADLPKTNDDPASAVIAGEEKSYCDYCGSWHSKTFDHLAALPDIDRAITAVEEGAVEALAKLLDAALCGASGTWDYNSASDKEAWRREARYLLAHASELRGILDSVQEVK